MSPSAASHSDTIDPLDTTASATSTPPPPSSALQRIPPPFIFSHPDSQDNSSNRPKDAHADPYSSLKRQSSPRPSFLENYKRRASQGKDVGKMGVMDDSNGTGAGHGRTGSTGGGLQAPRPHLNALSPLQSFTSLQPVSVPSTTTTATTMRRNSHSRNTSLHSNASSLASSPSQHAVHSGTTNGLGIYHGHSHGQGHGKGFGPMTPLTLSNLTRATGPLSAQGTDGSDSGLDPLTIHPHPHPRTPSVTRSLSRRESMIAKTSMVAEFGFVGGTGAASPGAAREADRGERGGAVSKLTLVRAFSGKRAGAGVGNANANAGGEERMDRPGVNRRRTKSGSSLSPFSFTPSAPLTTSTSNPSNLSGLLFSPPPAVGFARSPGPADLGVGASGGQASSEPNPGPGSSATRANFLFESMGGNGWVSSGSLKTCNPLNIHQETKNLSPDQVLELVEGLRSPVLAAPHARFSNRDRRGSDVSLASKAAGGEGTELEPVEYVEMNDDVLLPYVDRAAEVKELMEQASNYELFEIIRPTFPKESKITESTPLRATPLRSIDPEDWTWEEFQTHLLLSRAECDDFEWIKLARSAVRARSEALWERIGVCLGCDGDLLNAGETEIGTAGHHTAALSDVFDASTTAGSPVLSAHPDEFMNHDHVWVEGLSATEPEEMDPDHYYYPSLGERAPSIGSIPGTPGGLMDVAEEEESQSDTKSPPSLTPAQIAGGRGEPMDPFGKETSPNGNARSKELPGSIPLASVKSRARSFVGVQISTTPSLPAPASVHRPSYSVLLPGGLERGPGHPLFPSSFSTLSLAPTLPNNNPALKASLSFSQAADAMGHQAHGNPARAALQSMMGMNRKQSRSGLSESAITFGSEDY